MRIADRLWINAETTTFSALAQQPYKQKVLRRKNAKTRKFTKKIFLTGGRFFRKLFVFYKSFVGTQIVFIFHKLLGGTQIVSNFTSRLQAHNCFNFSKLFSDTQLLLFTSCMFSSNYSNFTSRLQVQIIASIFQNLLVAQLP